MKALYFDAFSGISGDMTLGALVDLGVPLELFREEIEKLGLEKVEITSQVTERMGIRAIKVGVRNMERGVVRTYANIKQIITQSPLTEEVKERSLKVFEILANAEAKVHSREVDRIHFHEIGATDTIVDIVGFSLGLHYLGVERVFSSAIPTGKGWIRTEHGVLPVPAPAVTEILKDVPVYYGEIPTEIVTPTGAAIVKSCAERYGSMPLLTVEKVGYGAGTRELDIPNVLRLILGELHEETGGRERETLITTNIDDMNPEYYEYVMEKLFRAGASDVWLTPIQMKKTRPAVSLTVLCPPQLVDTVKELIFQETNTLGLRISQVEKEYLHREFMEVETDYGRVKVKLGMRGGRVVNIAPEYGDCQSLADRTGVPLKEIYNLAIAEAQRRLKDSGDNKSDGRG